MDSTFLANAYVQEHVLSDTYRNAILRTAARCETLDKTSVNSYLKSRLDSVTSVTVANERRMLLTIWRWAFENELTDQAPKGILSIRVGHQSIKAWSRCQLKNLIECADSFPGKFRTGLPKRFFMKTWVLLGYETGARWGDLWRMRFSDIDVDTIRWSMHKTGDPMVRRLSVHLLTEASRLKYYSSDGTILGFACNKRYAMRLWKKLCESAGVDGTSKWLRRSGATHVECEAPGKGRVFLGHRTHGMADRHYLDRGQLMEGALVVPAYG